MKFKVGDKVLFYKRAATINTSDPPLNCVYEIIEIKELPYQTQYRWGHEDEQYFFDKEIKRANSYIIREKLGVK